MNNNIFLIILSFLVFFFGALPALFFSPGLAVLIWLLAVVMFLVGAVGRNKEIREEKIRRKSELEEQGRQRARQTVIQQPQQIVKETVTREVVLIQCRHCGARYPQGTSKCLTCGANL